MGKLFNKVLDERNREKPRTWGGEIKPSDNSEATKMARARARAIKQDYAGPEAEDFLRGRRGPTDWTRKEASRARREGAAGVKHGRSGRMFGQDAYNSDIQQRDINRFLRGRAQGQGLVASQAARNMSNNARASIAARAQGGTNPAAAMAAMRTQAQAGNAVAQKAAAGIADEQAKAQKNVLQAQAARRAQDQAALGQGLKSEGQDAAFRKFMENLAGNYHSFGTSESFQDNANKQAYADRLMQMNAMMNNKKMDNERRRNNYYSGASWGNR